MSSKRRWIAVCSCGDSFDFDTKENARRYIVQERHRLSTVPGIDMSRHEFTITREPETEG